MSLLFGESGLLSFSILAFWHDRQSPLFLASEGGVLDGNGFEVVVGGVDNKRGSSPETIYSRDGTGMYTVNLEIGVIVEVDEIGVSLSEFSKGSSSFELFLESILPLLSVIIEGEVVSNSPGVSRRRVVVIVDEATYGGQTILSLSN